MKFKEILEAKKSAIPDDDSSDASHDAFHKRAEQYGYEVSSVPDHWKSNHEHRYGMDVFTVVHHGEDPDNGQDDFDDGTKNIARVYSKSEATSAIKRHAEKHEPNLLNPPAGKKNRR